MDKITGNFLSQANKDFPLDCETLEYLQNLAALAAALGNIGGDKIVISGCAVNSEGTRRGEGYVFLRTKDHPEGEVLRWEGGPTTSGMYLKQEAIGVTANNVEYPKAYTRRTLAPGIGAENYKWEDFSEIKSIRELMDENTKLRNEITSMQGTPLGIVEMWAGSTVPNGYVLCDGRTMSTTEYPELFKALGTTFNTAISANGSKYTTPGGQFRVPDLRGRFVVGQHDSDNDYKISGNGGGVKTVTLTAEQTPSHSHDVKDYMLIPHGIGECRTGTWKVGGVDREVGWDTLSGHPKRSQTDSGKRNQVQWIKHPSEKTGGSESHENRPPYYVLAYIMRTK